MRPSFHTWHEHLPLSFNLGGATDVCGLGVTETSRKFREPRRHREGGGVGSALAARPRRRGRRRVQVSTCRTRSGNTKCSSVWLPIQARTSFFLVGCAKKGNVRLKSGNSLSEIKCSIMCSLFFHVSLNPCPNYYVPFFVLKVRRGQDLGSHIRQRRCDDATGPRKGRPSQRRFERSGRKATREQDGGAHAERAREDARLPQASDQRCGRIGANAGAPPSTRCFGNSPASLHLKSQQDETSLR